MKCERCKCEITMITKPIKDKEYRFGKIKYKIHKEILCVKCEKYLDAMVDYLADDPEYKRLY